MWFFKFHHRNEIRNTKKFYNFFFNTIIPVNSMPKDQLKSKSSFKNCVKQVINVSIWRKKRYVVWASSIPLALFGLVLPRSMSNYLHTCEWFYKVNQFKLCCHGFVFFFFLIIKSFILIYNHTECFRVISLISIDI